MNKIAKLALGAVALAGVAVATAAPAEARVVVGIGIGGPGYYGYHHHRHCGYYRRPCVRYIAPRVAFGYTNGFYGRPHHAYVWHRPWGHRHHRWHHWR